MDKKIIPFKEVTPEMQAEWKKQYGDVFVYKTNDGLYGCFFRSVDRTAYSIAAAKVSSSPALFNEIIVDSIWLAGDEEIRKSDSYYFGLVDNVEELMNKKKGQLSKL